MRRVLLPLTLLMSLCSIVSGQNKEAPYVILISFDGFRHDYIQTFDLPNFKSLIKRGAHAEALLPCFPSKTFPNHYSIVTGLYPAHHGLVDNTFYDPTRKEIFTMSNKQIATDPYYFGGTPIWRLAQQSKIISASYFWVGSEVPYDGEYPEYYEKYSPAIENKARVDQTLSWLKLPKNKRPHLITVYFSLIDDAGHSKGTDSEELSRNLKEADLLIKNLTDGVDKLNLAVNIIVVSDHGMKDVVYDKDTFIFLNEVIDEKDTSITITNSGTHVHLYSHKEKNFDSIYTILKKNEDGYQVYKASEFPEHWHYANSRSGDMILTAVPGKEFTLKSREMILSTMVTGTKWGVHGYDPNEVEEMKGIFYAWGPNIKRDVTIPAFRNIDIYPFIAKIFNLPLPTIDGTVKTLEGIYKP